MPISVRKRDGDHHGMTGERHSCDILIVGGGPAGMAAATSAAESCSSVIVLDENAGLGGQIWRGEEHRAAHDEADKWFKKVKNSRIDVRRGVHVFDQPEPNVIAAEDLQGVAEFSFQKLIIATGARERFLPFPGWTLPNVMGAGGLQALVKSGMPVAGKRVVVAGSGPLLLAVAAYLKDVGAKVLLIAEQASFGNVFGFASRLIGEPKKLVQAIGLRVKLLGIPYLTECFPVEAVGKEKLTTVKLKHGGKTLTIDCDFLACGFHLVPNVELALLLGCKTGDGGITVDEFQETSVPSVYAAGEVTGIGGVELSLVEGEIAGLAATDKKERATGLFAKLAKARKFAQNMNEAFALREELKNIVTPETFVCRCEDVKFGRVKEYGSFREAKLQTRCGMGPCQGRVCGAALEFLLGWNDRSVRTPVYPVKVENL